MIAFNGNDAARTERKECACESAGAGAYLNDGDVLEWLGCAGDACGEIEVEKEILAKGFLGREAMAADDLAQRRQIIDLRH